eukprot:m.44194 g.44194  ORF g.44194 m.44194 type:complete len:697 (+) comp11686_c0_seq1:354-2444(+)
MAQPSRLLQLRDSLRERLAAEKQAALETLRKERSIVSEERRRVHLEQRSGRRKSSTLAAEAGRPTSPRPRRYSGRHRGKLPPLAASPVASPSTKRNPKHRPPAEDTYDAGAGHGAQHDGHHSREEGRTDPDVGRARAVGAAGVGGVSGGANVRYRKLTRNKTQVLLRKNLASNSVVTAQQPVAAALPVAPPQYEDVPHERPASPPNHDERGDDTAPVELRSPTPPQHVELRDLPDEQQFTAPEHRQPQPPAARTRAAADTPCRPALNKAHNMRASRARGSVPRKGSASRRQEVKEKFEQFMSEEEQERLRLEREEAKRKKLEAAKQRKKEIEERKQREEERKRRLKEREQARELARKERVDEQQRREEELQRTQEETHERELAERKQQYERHKQHRQHRQHDNGSQVRSNHDHDYDDNHDHDHEHDAPPPFPLHTAVSPPIRARNSHYEAADDHGQPLGPITSTSSVGSVRSRKSDLPESLAALQQPSTPRVRRRQRKPQQDQGHSSPRPQRHKKPHPPSSPRPPASPPVGPKPSSVSLYEQALEQEGAAPEPVEMAACSICNRKFAAERLAKHETICSKNASKKRKKFDHKKQRIAGTDAAEFQALAKKNDRFYEKKTKAKKGNWRAKHEQFIAAIRAAKDPDEYAPPPPTTNPDYVKCPGCGRTFNEDAADRHIPRCTSKQKQLGSKPQGRKKR